MPEQKKKGTTRGNPQQTLDKEEVMNHNIGPQNVAESP